MVVKPEVAGSDTLEGVVRDMLKPMLKDWLDANLPEIVERMVAQEVARISGRSV
jgi:cell pole-organizing protein PopZ